MKTNQQAISQGTSMKTTLKSVGFSSALLRHLLVVAVAIFCTANIDAAQLIWDAGNTNNGATIDPASGGWDTDTTTNIFWNNGSGNVSWTQTSTTAPLNGAIFNGPDAAAGTYQVVMDGGQIAVTNMLINANGYAFSGSPLYQANSGFVQIADGKSVIVSNDIGGPNNQVLLWILGTGPTPATLSMFGKPGAGGGTSALMDFSSTNGSTVYMGGTAISMNVGIDINANVWFTNGTYTVGSINVGRNLGPFAGKTPALAGKMVVDGSSTVVSLGSIGSGGNANINIGQGTGQGTVLVQNGGTFNCGISSATAAATAGFGTLAATYSGEVDVYGGSFNVGNESAPGAGNGLVVMTGGCVPGCKFVLNQTNGTFTSYAGILIGGASGSYSGGYVAITNSGGFFNIGPGNANGIKLLALHPATNYITLSGGTVTTYGGSWATALPITLATLNGNITFQCADTASTTPYNITLSGNLSGPGGLNKTGGGILTLSGTTNNYAGSTVVSNGTLVIQTVTASTNGPVVIDGSAGSPVLSLTVGNSGQFWSIGNLTYAAGSPTADFNFGIISPSTTVAPIQSTGNAALTVTPNFTVEGNAIAAGTYPLIHYSGTYSGPTSTSVTFTGSASAGYVTNIVATKTIALVVTASSYTSAISWRVGNGIWDINTTANWTRNASASIYGDGDSVLFDDTASGTSPIVITLNTTVSPGSVTANNPTKSYVVSGNGTIAGPANVAVLGAGSIALAGTNTYSGGTIVNSPGQLNINFGGDNSGANSAIGTGSLTLNAGAKLDNTSGHPVTLIPNIQQLWGDDWTFNGSANFNTGPGAVTLGNIALNLTVVSNTFEVQGAIGESSAGDKLIKSGNGALTLRTDNSFSGGFELGAGTVNIGSSGCLGSGNVTINGGAIDNVSGSDLTLGVSFPSAYTWAGSFTFLGTGNLDFGSATITPSAVTVNVVSNTMTTEGGILSGNSTLTKTGAGTWAVGGTATTASQVLTVVVNQGELDLAKTGGSAAIGSGGGGANGASAGITVQSNALVKITGTTGNQIFNGSYVPVVLTSGGVLDMNGQNETVDLVTMTNGILRNGLSGSTSTLTVSQTTGSHPTNAITLSGSNSQFDVPSADAVLNIAAIINGSGNLVKTGLGMATLLNSNNYTGNITVSGGTLSLSFADITNTASVTITTNSVLGTNAVLNLNFANSETNTVAALVVGGISKPTGVYNATTDPLYITGTGSLLVVPLATINPLPGPIQFSISGSTLALSWPTNLGWILQNQTNSLSTGLTVNSNTWFDVSGSSSVTSTNITVNPVNPTVFFRLRHP